MTTFHTINTVNNTANDELISSLLDTTQLLCKCDFIDEFSQIKHQKLISEKIEGIAVKLSLLNRLGIEFVNLLKLTSTKIIVDAEARRLDLWLEKLMEKGLIHENDLKRIFITVQAKRLDSKNQLMKLQNMGVQVILVTGNNAYLTKEEISRDSAKILSYLLSKFENIVLLGINSSMKKKLEHKYFLNIGNEEVLELQGYQKLENSKIWSYYSGHELTTHAKNYLKRRNQVINKSNRFICRTIKDVEDLAINHNIFLFVDACSKFQYIWRIKNLTDMKKLND